MIKYKYVFWDWNGTLIDDLTTSIDSLNVSLAKRNLPLMTRERYFETFCFPVEEFYRKIGFNLEKESYQILADEFIENYNIEVKKAKLHPHAAEVIATLALKAVYPERKRKGNTPSRAKEVRHRNFLYRHHRPRQHIRPRQNRHRQGVV